MNNIYKLYLDCIVNESSINWYHGDPKKRENFNNQNMSRDKRFFHSLEYGPGIYFTSKIETAKIYGKYIHKAKISGSFITERTKPDYKILKSIIKSKPIEDVYYWISNYDYIESTKFYKNPDFFIDLILKEFFDDTMYESLMEIYNMLFSSDGNDFCKVVSKYFTGIMIKPNRNKELYYVVWDPNNIKIDSIIEF